MKLAYLPLNFVMPLQMKKINSIVVENPHIYDSMIMDLYRQMNREEEQWNLLQDEEFFCDGQVLRFIYVSGRFAFS